MALCAKCQKGRGMIKWDVWPCTLGNRHRVFELCPECDVAENDRILRMLRVPNRNKIIRDYRIKVMG